MCNIFNSIDKNALLFGIELSLTKFNVENLSLANVLVPIAKSPHRTSLSIANSLKVTRQCLQKELKNVPPEKISPKLRKVSFRVDALSKIKFENLEGDLKFLVEKGVLDICTNKSKVREYFSLSDEFFSSLEREVHNKRGKEKCSKI